MNKGSFNLSYDVFDDGRIVIIDVAGHTKGTILYKVQNESKFVLLK